MLIKDEKIQTRPVSFWNSSTFKIIIIGLLILALLIPGAMIKNLVRERETILEDARQDIISSWAEAQYFSGRYWLFHMVNLRRRIMK